MNQLMSWEWQLGSGNSFRLNTCLFDQDIFSPIKLFKCECEILLLHLNLSYTLRTLCKRTRKWLYFSQEFVNSSQPASYLLIRKIYRSWFTTQQLCWMNCLSGGRGQWFYSRDNILRSGAAPCGDHTSHTWPPGTPGSGGGETGPYINCDVMWQIIKRDPVAQLFRSLLNNKYQKRIWRRFAEIEP